MFSWQSREVNWKKMLLSLARQGILRGERVCVKWLASSKPTCTKEPNRHSDQLSKFHSLVSFLCLSFCKLLAKYFSDVPQWRNRTNIYSNPRHWRLFKMSDMKSCPRRLRLCKLFHSWYNFILKIFSGHRSSSKWKKNTPEEDKKKKTFSVKFIVYISKFKKKNEQSSDSNRKVEHLGWSGEAGHRRQWEIISRIMGSLSGI